MLDHIGIDVSDLTARERGPAQTGIHVAFVAETRELVDEFHAAALAAGGRDNGAPGLTFAARKHEARAMRGLRS